MGETRTLVGQLALASAIVLASGTTHAALFSIDSQSFTPGAGYGIDAQEPGTLLDIVFTASSPPSDFPLAAPGSSYTFVFGTINFREQGTIDLPPPPGSPDETDGLDVSARFVFASPLGSTKTVSATGSAVAGTINDSAADYTLTWTPIEVEFASTGLFSIGLETLSWNNKETSSTKSLNATITLMRAPEAQVAVPISAVPEPSTALLLGSALAAFGWRRRVTKGAGRVAVTAPAVPKAN